MYKLVISVRAEKQITKLRKIYQEALLEALEDIKENPLLGKPLNRELSGLFSYRGGIYRIIYKVNVKEKIVQVMSAGHRSTVYS